ncbi:hypothetical protein AVEN_160273-1 [Araneus ventricosus]|uniref:Uncharacterized protein n=1 Tax=Araneus ventricosus TaxID=182803 RepID=A0A4Y2GWM4_ARAVE|nr:hypothetical protein AVEN_2317-1 [Araneus ventricosus]GBM57455.1 hypothetical protein AVEN_100986-1 [Araneus ventricosus]GBM57517.1 hypothetical protein AVEN_45251-1 [Araneus ventricosus]GBM57585.1 hypothetical protein AVEN_160273-1 [Araneus ventricosus]
MDGLKIGTLWSATRPFDLERSFRECPTLVTLRRQTGYCGSLGCAKCYETLRGHSLALWIGVPISSQEQYGVSARFGQAHTWHFQTSLTKLQSPGGLRI